MKQLLAFFLILFPWLLSAQEIPVTWDVSTEKLNDSTYMLTLNGQLLPGWHVYASDNNNDGLESVKVTWDIEEIKKAEPLLAVNKPIVIYDKIFSRSEMVWKNHMLFRQKLISGHLFPASFKITITAFAANDSSFLPLTESKDIKLGTGNNKVQIDPLKIGNFNLENPVSNCDNNETYIKESGYLTIFLLGFAGGLIALLTPCVFPMVPVTVSYFTGRSQTRSQGINQGLLYGCFITLIYLFASVPFHIAGNIQPELFNSIATNAWVNIFFFLVFVFFALSFFGIFEIRLPAAISNAAGAKSGLSSIAGIFFMALTLATVSFSCTGPILGSLLVGSLSPGNGAWQLTAGMSGFGLALAFPFSLFAIFPHWMKRLPKSGGWMDTTKKVLAFIELGLAFKFLSNADLVENWGILKRELFIGIWIIITLCLALYLFGVFNKTSLKKTSVARFIAGSLALLFAFYLVPGLTQSSYANLKLLSGFPPPLNYSVYEKPKDEERGLVPTVVNDYEKAVKIAKQTGKPLLIDFTGWACINCRKMEEQVWTKPEISNLIKEKFILVSLYIDDRKKLPADKRFTYAISEDKKTIITQGDKWSTFQAVNFKQLSQPLYVLLSPNESLLNQPLGYTQDANKYKSWLECGLSAFQQSKTLVKKN